MYSKMASNYFTYSKALHGVQINDKLEFADPPETCSIAVTGSRVSTCAAKAPLFTNLPD